METKEDTIARVLLALSEQYECPNRESCHMYTERQRSAQKFTLLEGPAAGTTLTPEVCIYQREGNVSMAHPATIEELTLAQCPTYLALQENL